MPIFAIILHTMDIVRTLTFGHLKATLGSLKPKQKFFIQIFLFALILNLIPNVTHAFTIKAPTANEPILVFDTSYQPYHTIIDAFNPNIANKQKEISLRQEAVRRGKLVKIGRASCRE